MALGKVSLFLFVFLGQLFAYVDNDIDGVDDSIDLCLGTSFADLVDKDGCPLNAPYRGRLSVELAGEHYSNPGSEGFTNYQFAMYYAYRDIGISISNTRQTVFNDANESSQENGDIYLSSHYHYHYSPKLSTEVALGMKIASSEESISTGENDYFSTFSMDYTFNERQNIFASVGYTWAGDSAEISYKDTFNYAVGMGVLLGSNWVSSLSYEYSDTRYEDSEDYQAISLLNTYSLSSHSTISLGYTYGLDSVSYTHTLSLKIGMDFD